MIKFRIYHKELNKFLIASEEWFIGIDGLLRFYDIDKWQMGGLSFSLVDKSLYIIQQFTGLKDKNGRDIFEGDIISYIQHLFNTREENFPLKTKQVKWDDLLAKWNVFETNAGESDLEIIGNIIENPDLIK